LGIYGRQPDEEPPSSLLTTEKINHHHEVCRYLHPCHHRLRFGVRSFLPCQCEFAWIKEKKGMSIAGTEIEPIYSC
jgi:hypothetical protein